ncbi:MAG: twin-arginine translocase TatA/TatE family subunit [SAR202 cluster bacterium]|nr:twin-arginine translocase TatA/TatE family subunit [SAR202 cluster bacterium]
MSILGMGPFEILVVLLLAFIVLGPQRMIDATRQLGKTTRDLRHFLDELPSISLDEEPSSPTKQRSDTEATSANIDSFEDKHGNGKSPQ